MIIQFFRFLVAGGVAASANIGSRHLLEHVLSFEWAVALAYMCGMVISYWLMRQLVFGPSGCSKATEFQRFAITNLFGLLLTWTITVGLARLVFPALAFTYRPDDTAHLVGLMAPATTSYFVYRHFTFTTKPRDTIDLTTSHKLW